MRSLLLCFAVVALLALLSAPVRADLTDLSTALPAMPASVAAAVAQPHDERSTLGHTEDDLFFLELAQHVDNLSLLEAQAEHELEAEAAAEAHAQAEAQAQAEAEMEATAAAEAEHESQMHMHVDLDAEDQALAEVEWDLYDVPAQSEPAAEPVMFAEAASEPAPHAEAESEAEWSDMEFAGLLEAESEEADLDPFSSAVLLELEADLAADSAADAQALLEAEAELERGDSVDVLRDHVAEVRGMELAEEDRNQRLAAQLEDAVNFEGEIDASKHPNPQSLFRPRIIPNRRLSAHRSSVAEMKAWMQRIDAREPKVASAAEPDDGFLTVA